MRLLFCGVVGLQRLPQVITFAPYIILKECRRVWQMRAVTGNVAAWKENLVCGFIFGSLCVCDLMCEITDDISTFSGFCGNLNAGSEVCLGNARCDWACD